jgi:hypothetical protein
VPKNKIAAEKTVSYRQGIGQPDWYCTPIWLAIAFNIAGLFASIYVSEVCSMAVLLLNPFH